MLGRKIEPFLEAWKRSHHVLLIDRTRQIGKTYILRHFAQRNFAHEFYLNLYEDKRAVPVLREAPVPFVRIL